MEIFALRQGTKISVEIYSCCPHGVKPKTINAAGACPHGVMDPFICREFYHAHVKGMSTPGNYSASSPPKHVVYRVQSEGGG